MSDSKKKTIHELKKLGVEHDPNAEEKVLVELLAKAQKEAVASNASGGGPKAFVKIRLLKPSLGRGAGKTVNLTQAQVKDINLVEGEDYRVVGKWPKDKAPVADAIG